MAGRLRQELKQNKPFRSLREEVVLSMLRTADQLSQPMTDVLREEGLSLSQYNILRILRGAGKAGLPCGEVSQRMVRRDPDLTRLLDRLETRGLAQRRRGTSDRRVVITVLTDEGRVLLESLDRSVDATIDATLAHMSKERLAALRDLLEEVRAGRES